MAKHEVPGKGDAPPQWLQPYMGKKWKPLTLVRWYDILVDAGFITPRAGDATVDIPSSNLGS